MEINVRRLEAYVNQNLACGGEPGILAALDWVVIS